CETGLLQPANRDYSQGMLWPLLPDITPQEREKLLSCAAIPFLLSNVVAYIPDQWGITPRSMADFFDTKKFPGKRVLSKSSHGILEWCLLADGVQPIKIYSTLQSREGQNRAFAVLQRIANEVVWFDDSSQALKLLNTGQITMTSVPLHAAVKYRVK